MFDRAGRHANRQASAPLEHMLVTRAEFTLRTARALLPARPERALVFINRALAETVDPRLRNLISPALSMLERNNVEAAGRWLDRAIEYERARRVRRTPLEI